MDKAYRKKLIQQADDAAIVGKTVVANSAPSQKCYKSGEPCKYDCSGLCKESC